MFISLKYCNVYINVVGVISYCFFDIATIYIDTLIVGAARRLFFKMFVIVSLLYF